MAEYAIVVRGVIENVVTGDRAGAQRIALDLYHGDATVVLLDDLPDRGQAQLPLLERATVTESVVPDGVDRALWTLIGRALDKPCDQEHTVHRDDPSDYLARLWVNCGGETIDEQSFDKRVDSPDSMAEFCRYVIRNHMERTRQRAVYDAVTTWLRVGRRGDFVSGAGQ